MTGLSRYDFEKIFISLSISTHTGIGFFRDLTVGELGEYESAANEVIEKIASEMGETSGEQL